MDSLPPLHMHALAIPESRNAPGVLRAVLTYGSTLASFRAESTHIVKSGPLIVTEEACPRKLQS